MNSTSNDPISGNISSDKAEIKFPNVYDLDVPIAQRKGIRSCTQHPIADYVSYEKLSPNFRAFVTNLSSVEIPNSIHEAIKRPEWKAAVEEEV